ncbi:MAG TPA: vitamin K epoxide reductase family protein [Acidimicrobiales bacterium]|nr:vitamin K epoxide reductase family protein [Acidimicrobiales bacterium]
MSDDLRRGAGALLDRRRRLAGLSLGSIAAFVGVAAYQTGLIRHLPEPPIPLLDADSVDASGEAYQQLQTPDAALGIASSAITLVLIGMGDGRRAKERPWVPLAMAAKVGLDAVGGLYLTAEQATKHRKLCGWCFVATAAYLAMVPQVVPEARTALTELRSGRR